VVKYLGITLLPQAGVALGMAMKAQALADGGAVVAQITLFSVLIYELVGPTLTKMALMRAGEIQPEGKTSARQADAAAVQNDEPEISIEISVSADDSVKEEVETGIKN
jgi:hypothetical protein